MAAPNIANVTTITGKIAVQQVGNSATAIISNGAGSNKVLKVNSLYVSNIISLSATVTVDLFRSSTAYRITYQSTVPVGGSLDVLSKPIYLEEGDSLRLTGSATSSLEAVASYEEIS
jgi:hypothetical protein